MTNKDKIDEIIKERGLTKTELAAELGLSRYGLYKKLNNVTEFLPSEIIKLCDLLRISSITDREDIFFTRK